MLKTQANIRQRSTFIQFSDHLLTFLEVDFATPPPESLLLRVYHWFPIMEANEKDGDWLHLLLCSLTCICFVFFLSLSVLIALDMCSSLGLPSAPSIFLAALAIV